MLYSRNGRPKVAAGAAGLVVIPSAALALILVFAGFSAQERLVLRTRPWHLEAFVQSQIARCHTEPGPHGFEAELAELQGRADAAGECLLHADQMSWLRRDYFPCVSELLSVALDAQSVRIRRGLRAQEHQSRLAVSLATLETAMQAGDGEDETWSKYELRTIDQERARSLLRQARFLDESGNVESALICALRAWQAWWNFHHVADSELARFQSSSLRELWERQADRLLSWTRETRRSAILVDKLEHRCYLLARGKVEKSYPVNLGRRWYRPKMREQDASTPEGEYRVRRMIKAGKYGYALLLNYPNAADVTQFVKNKREGVVDAGARIGGNIEIHGGGRSDSDWTDGCVSLFDTDMRDLYNRAYAGMPVTIVGSCSLTALNRDGANSAN